jgi:hypothetical protein
MTYHGVVEQRFTKDGRANHAKNRDLWNRWALPALHRERVHALGLTNLDPLTELERQEIAGTLGIQELPDPAAAISLNAIRFTAYLMVEGFVLPGSVDFAGAHFDGHAEFTAAHFEDYASFRGAIFKLYAGFMGVHFERSANFSKANFKNFANFTAAHFDDFAGFTEAKFEGTASFSGAHFEGFAHYKGTHFEDNADFKNAHFAGAANFSDVDLNSKTIFDRVTFKKPPVFHQAELHQDTNFHEADFQGARAVVSDEAARAWQRLKVIMNEAHAHDQELRFFAYEMGVRGRMARWPVNWLYGLYETFSNYGRSMGLPVVWLAILNVVFGLGYYGLMDQPNHPDRAQFREDVASFTVGNVLPAVGGLNPARRDLYKRLFGGSGGIDIPFVIELLSIVQASVGIVLFFLLTLGIRNQFRIK